MIQRIQSIYLLISLIAMSLLLFFPSAGFTGGSGGAWQMYAGGIKEAGTGQIRLDTLPMMIWFAVAGILTLADIFLYNRRSQQLRAVVLTMILQVLSCGIIALYAFKGKDLLEATPRLLFCSAMPVVAAIFSYLAYRGIRADIRTLKSLDRLR